MPKGPPFPLRVSKPPMQSWSTVQTPIQRLLMLDLGVDLLFSQGVKVAGRIVRRVLSCSKRSRLQLRTLGTPADLCYFGAAVEASSVRQDEDRMGKEKRGLLGI